MVIKNHYLRLILYGVVSIILAVAFSSFSKSLTINPLLLEIINGIVIYVIVTFFGILFLNRLPLINEENKKVKWDYYGLFYLLYFIFVFFSIGFAEVIILAPMNKGFANIGDLGFEKIVIVIYGICFTYVYTKYIKFFRKINWI